MARPRKDNADYFPHDAGMRNDDRVKALRKRFKLAGYGIWNMLIEYLAGRDHFRFEYNEFTLEIIAGDFDAEVKDIQEVISYCLTLGLLQQEGGFIECKTLVNRLEPVLLKRKLAKARVSVTETPQRKGKEKERKGEKRKALPPPRKIDLPEPIGTPAAAFEYLKDNYQVIEDSKKICSAKGWRAADEIDIVGLIKVFASAKAKMDQPPDDVRQHFKNWLFREPMDKLVQYAATFKKSLA